MASEITTIKKILWMVCFTLSINYSTVQNKNYPKELDSLINVKSSKPFNGVILISQNAKPLYTKLKGFSNLEKQKPFTWEDQFVIGSISKQITAVLVLQQYEKEKIKLDAPIRQYLPHLREPWADTVTVHHLLTHTHGITELDRPVSFRPGTQYEYSQIGYQLLADIAEKVTGKSFALLSEELFRSCKMENTFHPDLNRHKRLAHGYLANRDGEIKIVLEKMEYIPAGGFISTPRDMLLWNTKLFEGNLLKPSTYALMMTKQKNATRNHPMFGITDYGYGITVDTKENILQLGQTGIAPGLFL